MLKAGITGGIGSGKTIVCQVFETLGIPVFYADQAARYLMENDALVIDSVRMLFGKGIYDGGKLLRDQVAQQVFRDPVLLQQLNAIVHPAVIRYGTQWMEAQQAPYVIKEAAIFFESGSFKEMDVMIGVYAPEKLRIRRAKERDNVRQQKVTERMAQQMNEEEKMKLCDFVITNDDKTAVLPQVLRIHDILLKRSAG